MKCITVHSFKGGTGKTFISLNMGKILSEKNKVCILDFDFRAPGLHVFFDKDRIKQGKFYINDYLRSEIDVDNCLIDFGNLSVALASPDVEVIRREISFNDKEEMKILERMLNLKSELSNFDYVIVDTSPGFSYRSVNSLLIGDVILNVLRPEKADIDGITTLTEVIKNISAPKYAVLNRIVDKRDFYFGDFEIIAEIPCSCDVNMNKPFFVEDYENHEVTKALRSFVEELLSRI